MTDRLPNLGAFIGGLRARGITVKLGARRRPEVIVPPGVELTGYEREVLRGQGDHITAWLGGDVASMAPQGFHEEADEPAPSEPEQPAPEPAEPEPADVERLDLPPGKSSSRPSVLWSGDSVRPDLRARDGEPTGVDFLAGRATQQRDADGAWTFRWRDEKKSAEMLSMMRRGPRFYGGE